MCCCDGRERLSFTATDLEIQIQTGADLCSGKESAAILVSARKLLDILRALPDDEVTLALANKRLPCSVAAAASVCRRWRREFPTVSQAEFNVDSRCPRSRSSICWRWCTLQWPRRTSAIT